LLASGFRATSRGFRAGCPSWEREHLARTGAPAPGTTTMLTRVAMSIVRAVWRLPQRGRARCSRSQDGARQRGRARCSRSQERATYRKIQMLPAVFPVLTGHPRCASLRASKQFPVAVPKISHDPGNGSRQGVCGILAGNSLAAPSALRAGVVRPGRRTGSWGPWAAREVEPKGGEWSAGRTGRITVLSSGTSNRLKHGIHRRVQNRGT